MTGSACLAQRREEVVQEGLQIAHEARGGRTAGAARPGVRGARGAVAEVGLDVAPVLADGVALVASKHRLLQKRQLPSRRRLLPKHLAVEAPAVAVPPAEELVAAAGVLAA